MNIVFVGFYGIKILFISIYILSVLWIVLMEILVDFLKLQRKGYVGGSYF